MHFSFYDVVRWFPGLIVIFLTAAFMQWITRREAYEDRGYGTAFVICFINHMLIGFILAVVMFLFRNWGDYTGDAFLANIKGAIRPYIWLSYHPIGIGILIIDFFILEVVIRFVYDVTWDKAFRIAAYIWLFMIFCMFLFRMFYKFQAAGRPKPLVAK